MKKIIAHAKKRAGRADKKTLKNYLILSVALGLFFVGLFFMWAANLKIPTLESFEERKIVESTKIYDKTGEILLYDVNQDIQRTVIPFENISRNIKNATIAIEDKEFYSHKGIKPTAILRAIFANTTSLGYSQGGSTITQQVVKNSLLTSEKKISRKIKEWVLALKIEKVLNKDQILAMYFNEIPYGGNIYGIEEASQTFLGKSASDLTIAEAAYLAAIPQAPTFYSPYGKNKNKLDDRKNLVLGEMKKNGFLTEEEYQQAKNEVVVFKPKELENIKAPHFVFYVIDQLQKEFGEDVVQSGGLRVKTTLDYEMQKRGEEIAQKYALENKKTFNAENAAFVAIDPKTGAILSMVGSRDYFDKEIDGNFNIATAHRQPGSTFKPFVYAQAFNKGYTPETVLFDVKTQFSTKCTPQDKTSDNGCYSPENYDLKYRGPLTLRESLAQSINITSVKTLYLAGISDSIRLAQKMGIESLGSPSQYGLTLVLGGGEVSLLEITGAYSVFANEGKKNAPFAITEVKDKTGKIIKEWKPETKEVLPRETVLKISSILSDNDARAPAFGQTSYLHFSNSDVAVKTGTTNDYKDAWIIGYTPNITLGAWAGNNNNTPMQKKVAGFIVAPMWRAYMDEIIKTLPNEKFPDPMIEDSFDLPPVLRGQWQGGVSQRIDTISQKNATSYTPKETTKEILSGGVHSILYWINKDNPREMQVGGNQNDPQFNYWEYGIQEWIKNTGYVENPPPPLPQGFDDIHTEENTPKLSLSLNDVYSEQETVVVNPSIQSKYPVQKVQYFLNNTFIEERLGNSLGLSFIPKDFGAHFGENILKIIVIDSVFNKKEFSFSLPIEGQ